MQHVTAYLPVNARCLADGVRLRESLIPVVIGSTACQLGNLLCHAAQRAIDLSTGSLLGHPVTSFLDLSAVVLDPCLLGIQFFENRCRILADNLLATIGIRERDGIARGESPCLLPLLVLQQHLLASQVVGFQYHTGLSGLCFLLRKLHVLRIQFLLGSVTQAIHLHLSVTLGVVALHLELVDFVLDDLPIGLALVIFPQLML